MELYKVNTTGYEEEDFVLLTDLTEEEISEVVNPIVMAERDGEDDYDNEMIFNALKKRYPKRSIKIFYELIQLTY